jgi:dihydrofolate synthase/folylpolyglutamate synthase
MLEALLADAGHKTGCYTSPHVLRYHERIRIDGNAASSATIIAAFERVQAARMEVPLTYFEFGTLAALVAFADAGADTLILEVGMGGRLDAVNAIEPDACLITNIALDHTAWLGDDIESIAREKAGIMRQSKPVIFGARECPNAIVEHATEVGADLWAAADDFDFVTSNDVAGTWSWHGRQHEMTALCPPALAGDIQMQNASAVLALIEAMGLPHILTAAKVNRSMGNLKLPGRFQVIDSRQLWVLDVAHNPAAAAALRQSLELLAQDRRVTAVVGMLADKDIDGIIGPLASLVDSWVAVSAEGSRAESATTLAQNIANYCMQPCQIVDVIADALEVAERRTARQDVILVTGSFYIVGPALDWLQVNGYSDLEAVEHAH